jgi:hypothetical protein
MRFVNIGYTYTYWLMTPSVLYHDLGEPDYLFADTYNFDVYAIFRLNLMVMEENKIIHMFKPSRDHHHDLGEPDDDDLYLQTYVFLLFMQFFT